ncbi:MAG: DUF2779 domain-containing protein [Chitinophagaceae bacterium]|nr:DUF2779 domain-containing protein [Chitinophagaceae bacterium]
MPFLTKSKFKIARNCTAQLYYSTNAEYANQDASDRFLAELAKGGFQVGTLAQCYYPDGVLIPKMDHAAAANKTLELLQQKNAIIFEAAFMFERCFVRTDIVVKKGNIIQLIEVKAKSFNRNEDSFQNTKNEIVPAWRRYLEDIAFQYWVAKQALEKYGLTGLILEPYLMLADKSVTCTINGLNQCFYFNPQNHTIEITDQQRLANNDWGTPILTPFNVAPEVNEILSDSYEQGSFADMVSTFVRSLTNNERLDTPIGKHCKDCMFYLTPTSAPDLKSGFEECWRSKAGFEDMDFKKAMIWDLSNFRGVDNCIAIGKYFLEDLDRADYASKKEMAPASGMSTTERKEQQVTKYKNKDTKPYVLVNDLLQEMRQWNYPLHMIDFETSVVALPFYAGMRPYETVAFQFSHHLIEADGTVVHKTEWINTQKGVFPNFEFVRTLKNALTNDKGTIFRYATHENSVLLQIYKQLQESNEPDKVALMDFIQSITKNKQAAWEGYRNMVDLCEVIKRYYYHPLTNGSNSIKAVLPAMLNTSRYLKEKYSQPIYGTAQMPSNNFISKQWVEYMGNRVKDPYSSLPPVFSAQEDGLLDLELLSDSEAEIKEGGAAMAAYSLLQFSHISEEESKNIQKALLRYCELDTLAMAMIYEGLREAVK